MSASLLIRNQQRARPVDVRQLRRATEVLLQEMLSLSNYDLAIHLVGSARMAALNWQHLQHEGPTDVITFGYADGGKVLHGELFICIDVAVEQARQFRTTWQDELMRYVIHGILHLQGYDDMEPAKRRIMKRAENRLLKQLPAEQAPHKLRRSP